jgi:large subunit ribosomal protein L24
MQRVISRAVAARKQAARKAEKLRKIKAVRDIQERKGSIVEHHVRRENLHETAMKHLEEDWALGPLAPRRESGVQVMRYGYADYRISFSPPALPQSIKTQKAEWRNSFMRNRFVKGDRVVIIRGMGQGSIGVINEVKHEQLSVVLRGVNAVRFNRMCFDAGVGIDSISLGTSHSP